MKQTNLKQIIVRIPEEEARQFRALLGVRGETAQDVLAKSIRGYIKRHSKK